MMLMFTKGEGEGDKQKGSTGDKKFHHNHDNNFVTLPSSITMLVINGSLISEWLHLDAYRVME